MAYKTIPETFVEYKGYKLRIKFSSGVGARADIFKVVGDKWFSLRSENWNYQRPDRMQQRMANYIDNYEPRLQEKLERLIQEHNAKPSQKDNQLSLQEC